MKKLYGIGTGPGDPELLTVKAVRLIESADVIFAPNNKGRNMALDSAQPYIKDQKIVLLDFPMGKTTRQTYIEAMDKIEENLKDGQTGVFLTIGDSMIYSTFMNMINAEEHAHLQVECVPGIPAFLAGANAILKNVVEKGERFLLVDDAEKMNLEDVDSVAILKTSKNLEATLDKLEEHHFDYYYIKHVSFDQEVVLTQRQDILKEKTYMSLLLARKSKI
ncbi:MAG: precorrin-2 C(20)-methyltransferase [Peptoniphilus sp. oral taxon 375]|nr:putative precorrin-2 C(20)-methyltransferase [Peptoniphilus sp. oral taxon 375 str. F0436]MBS4871416.1 precorrin-2 C(20)-methyltransferase [Peptoniphilus sp. oral taxon 375]